MPSYTQAQCPPYFSDRITAVCRVVASIMANAQKSPRLKTHNQFYMAQVPNVTTRSGSMVNMTRTSPVRIGV